MASHLNCSVMCVFSVIFFGGLSLQNKDQRSLDIDMAMEMLKILLGGSWTLLNPFTEFIEVSQTPCWFAYYLFMCDYNFCTYNCETSYCSL